MKLWAVLLTFVNFSTVSVAFAAEAPRMEADELKSLLGNPGVVTIDVRAGTDWFLTGDKIKGAVRENPKGFDDWYGKYSADKTLVLYCAWTDEGTSAGLALKFIEKGHRKVYALKGGWDLWKKGGYPVESK